MSYKEREERLKQNAAAAKNLSISSVSVCPVCVHACACVCACVSVCVRRCLSVGLFVSVSVYVRACVHAHVCLQLYKTRCTYALAPLRLTAAAPRLAEVSLLKAVAESENTVARR